MHVLRNFSSSTALLQHPLYVRTANTPSGKKPGKAFSRIFFFNFDKTLQTESRDISVVTPALREEIVYFRFQCYFQSSKRKEETRLDESIGNFQNPTDNISRKNCVPTAL